MATEDLRNSVELRDISSSLHSQLSWECRNQSREAAEVRRVGGRERLRLVVRAVLGALLFLAVLGCVTFSKLSLLALADKLRSMTVNSTKQEVTIFDVASLYIILTLLVDQ